MTKIIDFKKLGKVNLFERKGVVTIEVNGDSVSLPIKIKNLQTSIMDIDVKPNKAKLKKIVKDFHRLDSQVREMIENSEGFDEKQRGQKVIMYDLTDEVTSKELKQSALKSMVLEVVKELDMDYEDEDELGNKVTLWQLWGIEKGNYDKLSEVFMALGVDEVLITQISVQIAKIKNGTMLTKLEDTTEAEVEKSPSKTKRKPKSESDITRNESIS